MKKNMNEGNRHGMAVNRIKGLYENMLKLDQDDLDYANKVAKEICRLQREDGSWKVFDEERIESDCMIGYGYVPTYYGAAALIHLMNIDGGFEFENELSNAISYISDGGRRKHFPGHGFDVERDQLEALAIFKAAGLYQWLLKFGKQYEDIAGLINTTINDYREAVATGRTYGGFAEDFKEEYMKKVEEYEASCTEDVWYVAYGSNINEARFNEYIALCNDKTEPTESLKYVIPHDIYFAYSSSRWGRKGVAFLEDTKPGKAYGRAYKIKMEQFYEIMSLEGAMYNKKVYLGVIDGVPVYTFTSKVKRVDIKEPSDEYLKVILLGLKQTYNDKSPLALELYLYGRCVLDDTDKSVLGFIRNSEHGVSLNDIAIETMDGGITKTRKAVVKLMLYGFIKQDSMNARQGHGTNDREAVVYTKREKRNLIDLILEA